MATKQGLLVKAGETRSAAPLGIFGNEMTIKLSSADTDGNYAIIEDHTPPNGGPPLHRHSREDESFYVIEGQFVFEVDGQELYAGPGSSVFAPRGTAHRFQNLGVTPGRLLVVVQPGGLDEFFTEIDHATEGAREPDLNLVLPVFKKHGLELLGPPLNGDRKMILHDEQAIRELVSTFVGGWNAGDGQLCGQPFAPDADFTAVTGQHAKGRSVISKVHDEILATVFRGTHNSAHVNDIRFLRPDVAAVDVTFRIQPMADKPWLPRYSSCGFVATKENGSWSIAVFRNMVPFERPLAGPLDRGLLDASRAAIEAGND